MAKRSLVLPQGGHLLPSPGLERAPVLDLMCSHFVLTLAARQGASFNVRRDFNGVVGLAGRHLVWPVSVLGRLREYLARRCMGNELWRGHETLSAGEFLTRFGTWCGPYDEATLFFFLDEYAKDQPKDLISVLATTSEWLQQALKKQSTLVEKTSTPWRVCYSSTRRNVLCCSMGPWPVTSETCAAFWWNSRSTTLQKRLPQ